MSEIPEDIAKVASELATTANTCCYRSDGYEEDMADLIARAILAERERHQWQDIWTAPRDGTPVDLWGVNHLHPAKTGRRATGVTWGRVRDWLGRERDDWQHGHGEDFEPTHWMPRPAPPAPSKARQTEEARS